MEERIIIAGFGGQGVQSMGQLITYAGMLEGKNVSWLPSYGPEMRGGTTNCMVIVSDDPVGAPLVDAATCVMVLNRPSLDKFEAAVEPGQRLYVNSSLVDRRSTRTDIQARYIPCNDTAAQLGETRVANMVMLGAYLHDSGIASLETVMEALAKVLGPNKAGLLPVNRQALEQGMALARG